MAIEINVAATCMRIPPIVAPVPFHTSEAKIASPAAKSKVRYVSSVAAANLLLSVSQEKTDGVARKSVTPAHPNNTAMDAETRWVFFSAA